MFRRSLFGMAAALLLSAPPALAHHAFSADFDSHKQVTLDGTITRVEWTNPHAHIYLDVTDTSGKTANWRVELGSRDELAGWTTPPLAVGQKIVMRGWQAKNGSTFANADSLTLTSGNKLSGASSYYVNYSDGPDSLAGRPEGRPLPGHGTDRARNTSETGGVGTRGVSDRSELPGTASSLLLIGLLGTLSAFGSLAVNRARR